MGAQPLLLFLVLATQGYVPSCVRIVKRKRGDLAKDKSDAVVEPEIYAVGKGGAKDCPDQSQALSEEGCKTAAKERGGRYKKTYKQWAIRPYGCFFNVKNNEYRYNIDVKGTNEGTNENPDVHPVCMKQASEMRCYASDAWKDAHPGKGDGACKLHKAESRCVTPCVWKEAWHNCKGCVECEPRDSIRHAWLYDTSSADKLCTGKWRVIETEAECELAAASKGFKYTPRQDGDCVNLGEYGSSGPSGCFVKHSFEECIRYKADWGCGPSSHVTFFPCNPGWPFMKKICATEAYPHNETGVEATASSFSDAGMVTAASTP